MIQVLAVASSLRSSSKAQRVLRLLPSLRLPSNIWIEEAKIPRLLFNEEEHELVSSPSSSASSTSLSSPADEVLPPAVSSPLSPAPFVVSASIGSSAFPASSTRQLSSSSTVPAEDGVVEFRNQLENSHAVLFIASEYPLGFPYAMTAPLQNAFDWGSCHENLFNGKTAGFVSLDNYNALGSRTLSNCYHIRLMADVLGMRCLQSKFDLHPEQHYSLNSEYLDDAQVVHIKKTMNNLVRDLAHFHIFETKTKPQKQNHFNLYSA